MTATATTPRILRLPANATWRQPGPRPGNLRPCEVRPANWWDTGDPGNPRAIAICNTCPFKDDCAPKPGEQVPGTIRAGVAYNDDGRTLPICNVCRRPKQRAFGARWYCNHCAAAAAGATPSEQHDRIAAMRAKKLPWTTIGPAVGTTPGKARAYWQRHLAAQATQRGLPLERLPGVTDHSNNRPGDYHDTIIGMLSNPDIPYTYEEVAWVIGSTGEAVKSHWRRHRARQAKAGLPVLSRSHVSNRRYRQGAAA